MTQLRHHILPIVAVIAIGVLPMLATTRLSVDDFFVAPGDTVVVNIWLDTDCDSLTQFQFGLSTAEGAEFIPLKWVADSDSLPQPVYFELNEEALGDSMNYDVAVNYQGSRMCVAGYTLQRGGLSKGKYCLMRVKMAFGDMPPMVPLNVENVNGGCKFAVGDGRQSVNQEAIKRTTTHIYRPSTIDEATTDGQMYFISTPLAVVDTLERDYAAFVTDGNGNWIRLEATDRTTWATLMNMRTIEGGAKFAGIYDNRRGNRCLMISQLPGEATEPFTVLPQPYDLTGEEFTPQVNEVISLVGYYDESEDSVPYLKAAPDMEIDRDYELVQMFRNIELNLSWCRGRSTLSRGALYTFPRLVVQAHPKMSSATVERDSSNDVPRRIGMVPFGVSDRDSTFSPPNIMTVRLIAYPLEAPMIFTEVSSPGDDAPVVGVTPGHIEVTGARHTAIYNVCGALMATRSADVPPGVYLVVTDGKTKKVIVN